MKKYKAIMALISVLGFATLVVIAVLNPIMGKEMASYIIMYSGVVLFINVLVSTLMNKLDEIGEWEFS